MKPSKPSLLNHTYDIISTKPHLQKQTYPTKPTKPYQNFQRNKNKRPKLNSWANLANPKSKPDKFKLALSLAQLSPSLFLAFHKLFLHQNVVFFYACTCTMLHILYSSLEILFPVQVFDNISCLTLLMGVAVKVRTHQKKKIRY